jgi:translocation and assembly module TamB
MARARRITTIALGSAAVLVSLVLVFAAFVLFTTPGGRLALRIANGRNLPARAEAFDGVLASRLRLMGVELRIGQISANIDTVTIAWRPQSLRNQFLEFREIDVAGARLVILEGGVDSSLAATDKSAMDTTTTEWKITARRVRVRRASVTAPGDVRMHDVDVVASGGPAGYRADVSAAGDAWRLHDMRVFARASGNTQGATLDSLDVHTLGGVVRGGGFVRWTPGVSWNARLDGDNVHVGEIAPAPEEWLGAISFRARGTGTVRGDSTRVDVGLASLDGTMRDRPLSASGRVALRGTLMEASDLRIAWGSARATLSGSMGDVADVTLDASIPSLAEILPRAHGSASVKGRLTGTPSAIRVNVTASGRGVRAAGRDIPDLEAVVDAGFEATGYAPYAVDVRRGNIRLSGGTLDLRGRVSWKDAIDWDVALATRDFETGTLTPARWDVRGPLSLSVKTSGRRSPSDLRAHVAIENLSGTFRDRDLSGRGVAEVRNREADFSDLVIDWGEMHIAAHGHYGDMIDLAAQVDAPDLSLLRKDLSGSVKIDGTAKGPLRRPTVDATFAVDSLRVRNYSVARLEGDVDVDPEFNTPARAHVIALGVSSGGTPLDSVRVDLEGPREGHRASIAIRQGELDGALSARGTLADSVWTGRIESMRLHQQMAGTWTAAMPAMVRAAPSSASLDSLVLVSNGARLSLHGAWARGDTANVRVDLDQFPLSTFARYFPAGTRITGTLDGDVFARIDPAGRVTVRASLEPGPGRVALSGKWVDYDGRFTAQAGGDGITAAVDMSLTRGSQTIATVDGDLAIPGFVMGRDSLGTQPLNATLNLDCSDIAPLLAVIAPDFATTAAGVLTARVSTLGTAGDFSLAGSIDLANARFDLASGLRLRDVGLKLVSDGAGRFDIDGGATSGGGRVNLTASSTRPEGELLHGTFAVKGERFQLLNQPDAQVFVSPDIEVQLAARNLDMEGDVRVPFARIEVAEVPSTAVAPSRDVVFMEDTLSTRARVHVHTRVRVALGDSVSFNGFGLRAHLGGSLLVEDEVGRPTRGTGEILLKDGKYRAYGNDLTIDRGRFIFGGGPIDNPGIDVRAVRGLTSQNVMSGSSEMVGVQLSGSLRKPEFSVFSNPPMSESEVLSYLMFGRPLSSGSSSEQAALTNMAMVLGMAQGNQLAGDIGKQFALDEAYLETGEDLKEASFVAGKYLSPKLYVSYAAGFFDQTNTFRVRYTISDKWTVQAENGRYNSSDLLYRFELGK